MLLTLAQRKQLFAICSCTLTSLSDSLALSLSHTHTLHCLFSRSLSSLVWKLLATVCVLAIFMFASFWQHLIAFWLCRHDTHTHTHIYRRGTYTCSDSLTTWCSITIWQSDGFYRFLWDSNRKLCRNLICNLNWLLEFLGHAPQISWACVCVCVPHINHIWLWGYAVHSDDDNIQSKCSKSSKFAIHHVRVSSRVAVPHSASPSPLIFLFPPTPCGLCACVSEVIKIPGCLFKVAFYSKSKLI